MSHMKLGVFWDLTSLVPTSNNASRVVASITSCVSYIGSLSFIKAYTEQRVLELVSQDMEDALQMTGVSVIRCPQATLGSMADKMMTVDILNFAHEDPTASIAIITANPDFAYLISSLRMRAHPVLLIMDANKEPHPYLTGTEDLLASHVCMDGFDRLMDHPRFNLSTSATATGATNHATDTPNIPGQEAARSFVNSSVTPTSNPTTLSPEKPIPSSAQASPSLISGSSTVKPPFAGPSAFGQPLPTSALTSSSLAPASSPAKSIFEGFPDLSAFGRPASTSTPASASSASAESAIKPPFGGFAGFGSSPNPNPTSAIASEAAAIPESSSTPASSSAASGSSTVTPSNTGFSAFGKPASSSVPAVGFGAFAGTAPKPSSTSATVPNYTAPRLEKPQATSSSSVFGSSTGSSPFGGFGPPSSSSVQAGSAPGFPGVKPPFSGFGASSTFASAPKATTSTPSENLSQSATEKTDPPLKPFTKHVPVKLPVPFPTSTVPFGPSKSLGSWGARKGVGADAGSASSAEERQKLKDITEKSSNFLPEGSSTSSFEPVSIIDDLTNAQHSYQSITLMSEYRKVSFEELRLNDYAIGKRKAEPQKEDPE